MSVLIKGMEMPSDCFSCDFCNVFVTNPYCRRLLRRTPNVARLKDCPLSPATDAVDVVRCMDCKHYLYSNEKCGLIDTRLNFYATDKIWTNDCFCAWGERRDDGEIH